MEHQTFTPEQMIRAVADLAVNRAPVPMSIDFCPPGSTRLTIRTADDSPLTVDMWLRLMASDTEARIGGQGPDGLPFDGDKGRRWCTYGADISWMGWSVHVWCSVNWPEIAPAEAALALMGA